MSRLAPTTWGGLRVRITAAFLAVMLAMSAALGFLMLQYRWVSATQALLTDGYIPLARVVDELDRDHQRVDTDVRRLLEDLPRPGTGSSSVTAIYAGELEEALVVARRRVERAKGLATDGEERAILHKLGVQLDRIGELYAPFRAHAAEVVRLAEAGQRDEAQAAAAGLVDEGARVSAEIDKLSRQLSSRIGRLAVAAEERRLRANLVSVGIAGAAFSVSLGLVGAVVYALGPIGRLTAEVQQVAAGGGRPIAVRGSDELAILASEFNGMVVAIQQRDRRLSERAVELDRLSRYLGSVLDALVEGLVVVEDGAVTLANPAALAFGARVGAPPPPTLPEAPGFSTAEIGARKFEVRTTPFGTGRVHVVTDMTDRLLAQERLARAERLALVGQLLAQVTHEVRNPLNALSLNAELLADELGALDPERRSEGWEILGVVSGEIQRLTDVTGHYLQLARRPAAELAPEDLDRLLGEIVRLVEPELAARGARVTRRLTELPPQWIDGSQLRRAVLNTVRNAIEADAHEITLSTARRGALVELTITDDGQGMTDEQIAHATDPFYSTKAQGTGLGLAITRQILEDHGGTLRVESAAGAGATVVLSFPWRPAGALPEAGVGSDGGAST